MQEEKKKQTYTDKKKKPVQKYKEIHHIRTDIQQIHENMFAILYNFRLAPYKFKTSKNIQT